MFHHLKVLKEQTDCLKVPSSEFWLRAFSFCTYAVSFATGKFCNYRPFLSFVNLVAKPLNRNEAKYDIIKIETRLHDHIIIYIIRDG